MPASRDLQAGRSKVLEVMMNNGTRVLVADDDESVRDLVAAVLGQCETYHTLLARDGSQALDMARQESPDVLLLDIWMPEMTGWEVCETVKRDPALAKIKVVILSGLTQASVRRRAFGLGADDYLTKPFEPAELLEAVRRNCPGGDAATPVDEIDVESLDVEDDREDVASAGLTSFEGERSRPESYVDKLIAELVAQRRLLEQLEDRVSWLEEGIA